jgi:hypothetical protein
VSQACKNQEASRTAAIELMDEWDKFLSIDDRAPELGARGETRKALGHLLELVASAANYIINLVRRQGSSVCIKLLLNSSTQLTREQLIYLSDDHRKTIEDLKKRFDNSF